MINWQENKDKIESYYKDLINQYGHDPRACDYGHANSQKIKFNVLSDVCDLSSKSVLDVGCGFADYAIFLKEKFANVNYEGVDLSPDMIQKATGLHPDLKLRTLDILKDDVSRYDLVTANGIFYLLKDNPCATMRMLISRMYELCNKAIAFNSLSNWCLDQEQNEFYADPLETLKFCKTITPWVTLRHDYHPRDFTIYMYRNRTE